MLAYMLLHRYICTFGAFLLVFFLQLEIAPLNAHLEIFSIALFSHDNNEDRSQTTDDDWKQ